METKKYPEKITVDVKARLHLEHTDKKPEEHRIIEVNGKIESFPNKGDYNIVLEPQDNIPFSQMTSGPCVVLVIVLYWIGQHQRMLKLKKRERKEGFPLHKTF